MSDAPPVEGFVPTVMHMWGNGGRPLLIACILLATALVFLLAAYLAVLLRQHDEVMPVKFLIPITITSQAAEYRPGDTIEFRRTRCSTSERPESIASEAHYRRIDLVQANITSPTSGNTSVVVAKSKDNPDGCETSRLALTLPALPPGVWVYEGEACLRRNPKLCTSWKTEQFRTVP